jgi:hypothetical protein
MEAYPPREAPQSDRPKISVKHQRIELSLLSSQHHPDGAIGSDAEATDRRMELRDRKRVHECHTILPPGRRRKVQHVASGTVALLRSQRDARNDDGGVAPHHLGELKQRDVHPN